jgi:hypothetical protein
MSNLNKCLKVGKTIQRYKITENTKRGDIEYWGLILVYDMINS